MLGLYLDVNTFVPRQRNKIIVGNPYERGYKLVCPNLTYVEDFTPKTYDYKTIKLNTKQTKGENTTMSASTTLNAAIQYQLTHRVKRNAEGKLLCRRCNGVVPESHSFVFWNPEDESNCWGPCCSDECICHLKICSKCNKDFVIDHEGEITHVGDGVWLCKECIQTVEVCPCCNRRSPLVESPEGKICEKCFKAKYFKCSICGHFHNKRDNIQISRTQSTLASWTHCLDTSKSTCETCFKELTKGKTPLPVRVCDYCGDCFNTSNSPSDKFCNHCIGNKYVRKCNYCNEYTKRWDSTSGDLIACRDCFSSLVKCSCCKEVYIKRSEGKKVRGKIMDYLLCNECANSKYVECPSCFSLTIDPLIKVKGKKDICSHCTNHYKPCTKCGKLHFEEGCCRKDISTGLVCSYSYKPLPYFNYNSSTGGGGGVIFGFENEINYKSEDYDSALKSVYQGFDSNVLYLKSDGSISGAGFEVVSHPMTLDFFDSLDLSPLYSVSPKDRDTSCGLHVHVSRSSFSGQSHLYKLTEFINSNKTLIKKIAGREFCNYAMKIETKVTGVIKGTGGRERYHAVNLTNKNTVEIRIFKSARNELQLRSRIEFVNALVEFTRNVGFQSNTADGFKKWLKSSIGYRNLKKVIK